MSKEFNISRNVNGAFRLSLEQLASLEQAVRTFIAHDVEIRVSFDNGHRLSFSSIQDLSNDTLTRARAINDISISSSIFSPPNRAYVKIDKTWIRDPISYDLSGDRDLCIALEQRIVMEAKSGATWWNNIRQFDNISSILLTVLITFPLAYFEHEFLEEITPLGAAFLAVFFYLFSQLLIVTSFPKLQFNFGKISVFSKFRAWIGSAVLVGYPTAMLYDYLKEKIF